VAKQVLTNVRLFVGPSDLTGQSNKVEVDSKVEVKETTNFNSGGAKEVIGGLEMTDFSAEGLWEAGNTVTVDIDDEMWGDRRTVQAWTVGPSGAAASSTAYLTQALRSDSKLFAAVGEVAPWTMAASSSWPLVQGMFIVPPTTYATTTSTAGVQLGAVSSTQRLYASMHVLSVSGTTPSVTAIIESDSANNFPSPITQITFTATGAQGSQISRTAIGANTDTWYRATFTISGGTPNFLIAAAVGIGNH
jgi:hypothetical protein